MILILYGTAPLSAQSLYVRDHTGNTDAYPLAGIRKISFSPGSMFLTGTSGASRSYVLKDLESLNYAFLTSNRQTNVPLRTANTIQVFPNPATGLLNLRLSPDVDNSGRLEIISADGTLVLVKEIYIRSPVYQVDISDLPKGFYVCRFSSGSGIGTATFIKQ